MIGNENLRSRIILLGRYIRVCLAFSSGSLGLAWHFPPMPHGSLYIALARALPDDQFLVSMQEYLVDPSVLPRVG